MSGHESTPGGRLEPSEWLLYGIAALIAIPLTIVVAAFLVDLVSWALTGHELMPWIGDAFRDQPKGAR